ncbi:thiamine phosphate synthase [Coraliomargarita akajimensis]|uniref:Thiamine-phosphate synthase n=1 Tax=Coraliomargarita akajimensis (strain DSM 45221 / IAM 15411 / JCM 23193 / KCTC 12865 / 04OKA010-24) TaxID=583355 RepID=D5EPX7_CORAD|nr:thiamine phosphate synthase [Coraliomargarita akajimensis]ADE55710.1 Thiamine-phosphate diphosphorylase [Coraliomargarita akajimensis DSM 45221]
MNWPKLMCLTTDGVSLSHSEQVQALCSAGVDWIQLRSKELSDAELEPIAFECLIRCREVGATFVLNDRVELALNIGADGVHIGKQDMAWREARKLAGADFIIGGTVNSIDDAQSAIESDVLDYVGVGPFKFTQTKQNLAPVLSDPEWVAIVQTLGELPSYAIGGIEARDLERVNQLGVNGAAVCSVLYRDGTVMENYKALLEGMNVGVS